MSEPREVIETLRPLAKLYPHFKPDATIWQTYYSVLSDIPIEDLKIAVISLSRELNEFMPVPGAIRQRVIAMQDLATGTLEPYAAWEAAMQAIRDGRGHELLSRVKEFDIDPLVDRAVRFIGGWSELALSENLESARARFIDAYREVLKRRENTEMMLPAERNYVQKRMIESAISKLTKRLEATNARDREAEASPEEGKEQSEAQGQREASRQD